MKLSEGFIMCISSHHSTQCWFEAFTLVQDCWPSKLWCTYRSLPPATWLVETHTKRRDWNALFPHIWAQTLDLNLESDLWGYSHPISLSCCITVLSPSLFVQHQSESRSITNQSTNQDWSGGSAVCAGIIAYVRQGKIVLLASSAISYKSGRVW